MITRLIGITGFKTSGKDTAYKAVAEALPDLNVKRVAFADKLKELSALALGFEGSPETLLRRMDEAKEYWEIGVKDRTNQFALPFHLLTGRAYLQNIGVAARDLFGDQFWVDVVLPKYTGNSKAGTAVDTAVEEMYPGVDVLCVTDARYPNEAERIKQLGGEIWQIVRPGLESDGHSSEIPLEPDKIDLSIYNGYDIPTLYQSVANALTGNVHPYRENAGV